VVVALTADLTSERHRTKAMAMIGSTIGFAFALSLIVAPVLYRWIGLSGVFYVTGLMSFLAIWLLFAVVPNAAQGGHAEQPARARDLPALLAQPELMRLNVGIFVLHVSQMAMFVVVPPMLVEAGLALPSHWKFYLPVVLVSFVLMVPAVFYADRRNHHKPVLLGTVLLLAAVEVGLAAAPDRIVPLAGLMIAFFVAFNVLEALLPSLVSRIAPAKARGTAIAVYNTTQTLGLFVGGAIGGWLAKHHGPQDVFTTCAALAAVWLLAAAGMRPLAPKRVNELAESDVSRSRGA
jgi:predicted MFS family arabinose efflux permease